MHLLILSVINTVRKGFSICFMYIQETKKWRTTTRQQVEAIHCFQQFILSQAHRKSACYRAGVGSVRKLSCPTGSSGFPTLSRACLYGGGFKAYQSGSNPVVYLCVCVCACNGNAGYLPWRVTSMLLMTDP